MVFKVGDFRDLIDKERINEWFGKGLHGWIGGTYQVIAIAAIRMPDRAVTLGHTERNIGNLHRLTGAFIL